MTTLKNIKYDKYFQKIWPFVVILIATYLLAQVQLSNQHTVLDIDTMFHYSRFNDIAEQLKNGNFSYFQTNFAFEHSGRIINALYGPFFAYLNGLLILICGSWFNYQIITYFILGLGSGIGMFLLCRKVSIPKIIAVLLAVIYINIGSIQAWFDHTNLIAWGALYAPYVFIEGINMIQNHQHPIRWIRLMIIMGLIGQTHLLSIILLSLGLLPFAISGLITAHNRKKFLFNLFKAVVGTIILTANVWGAILLIFSTNHLVPTLGHDLALNALHFSNFGTIRSNLLLGIGTIFILQIIYSLLNFKSSTINKMVTLEGGLFLFISSSLVPWAFIQTKLAFLSSYLQFPHRFLIIAYPLLLVGIGLSINELSTKKESIYKALSLIVLGFILLENFGSNYNRISQASSPTYRAIYHLKSNKYYLYKDMYNQSKYYNYVFGLKGKYQVNGVKNTKHGNIYIKVAGRGDYYKNTSDLEKIYQVTHQPSQRNRLFKLIIKVNPDYLPAYKNITATQADSLYIRYVIKPNLSKKFKYNVLPNGKLKLTWSGVSKTTNLPIILYHQSALKVNGKLIHPKLSPIGTPILKTRKQQNYAILQFITPGWFKILLTLTIISWLLLIFFGIKKSLQHFLCRKVNFTF